MEDCVSLFLFHHLHQLLIGVRSRVFVEQACAVNTENNHPILHEQRTRQTLIFHALFYHKRTLCIKTCCPCIIAPGWRYATNLL